MSLLKNLRHTHDGDAQPAWHRRIVTASDVVAERGVKGFARERGTEFDARETRALNRFFARDEQALPDPAPFPTWMHKERAHSRRVMGGIEFGIFSFASSVPAVNRLALAPAAAANGFSIVFHHKISAVANELSIDVEYRSERRIQLRG